jgi:type I restriction enzyme, S subunit
MGSDWTIVRIGDIADVIGGGTPSSKVPEYWGEEIPWITPKDLSSHFFREIEKGERNISLLGLKKSSTRLLPAKTVLVTSRAPIGYVAIAKNEVCTNQGFKSLILKKDHCPEFFYYLIKFNVPKLEAHSSGSTFKEISGSVFKQIELAIPPLFDQVAIAQILGSLDDKIELNRRMNETLEGMAQALFKSWFVDFDPVIDNALEAGNSIPEALHKRSEIRRKALADGTANRESLKQFPSSFQLTEEMGWIPEGWETGTVKNLCLNIQNGGTPKRDNLKYWEDGQIPWLTSGEVRQSLIIKASNQITETGLKMSSAKWLPKGATVIAMYGATAGQVAFISCKLTTNQAVCGLIPKEHYQYFNYLLLERNVRYFENQARGSAQQNISKGIIENSSVILPSLHNVGVFENKAHPLFEKWAKNIQLNEQLSKLRDTLLPKLISGELRIPDAEKLVEEVL